MDGIKRRVKGMSERAKEDDSVKCATYLVGCACVRACVRACVLVSEAVNTKTTKYMHTY